MALPPAPLTSVRGHAKNDSRANMMGGGGGEWGVSPIPSS